MKYDLQVQTSPGVIGFPLREIATLATVILGEVFQSPWSDCNSGHNYLKKR